MLGFRAYSRGLRCGGVEGGVKEALVFMDGRTGLWVATSGFTVL